MKSEMQILRLLGGAEIQEQEFARLCLIPGKKKSDFSSKCFVQAYLISDVGYPKWFFGSVMIPRLTVFTMKKDITAIFQLAHGITCIMNFALTDAT